MNREISGMVACLVTPLAFSTPSLFRFASRQEDLHRKLGPGVDAARKLVERQLSCPWGKNAGHSEQNTDFQVANNIGMKQQTKTHRPPPPLPLLYPRRVQIVTVCATPSISACIFLPAFLCLVSQQAPLCCG